MQTIAFDKLLLKTAFCCMASDGNIDKREIISIKTMCENSPLFKEFNFQEEINVLVGQINTDSKEFISSYFDMLNHASLTEEEELLLIDFAIQTIKADDQIEYSEIKFFKNIRHRLNVTDGNILAAFPDLEIFLERDIISEHKSESEFLDTITKQYLENVEMPEFELISDIHLIDNSSEATQEK